MSYDEEDSMIMDDPDLEEEELDLPDESLEITEDDEEYDPDSRYH